MRQRYRLYRRKKGGRYYLHDDATGRQESLHTSDRATALRLLHARQEAEEQPAINLQIAKAYLAATDESFINRTWHEVMDEFVKSKSGSNRTRCQRAVMATTLLLQWHNIAHRMMVAEGNAPWPDGYDLSEVGV